ncbi:MAG TPA: aspartate kinase [Aggregatilineales bacterium]|nr:aspartate kinase [Aggregatilineales bacterium]
MATLVMKFGGSLTADARGINRVAQVIMAESLAWDHLVVVISSMAGVTDALLQAVERASAHDGPGYRKIVANLRRKHVEAIETLIESEALRADLIEQIDRLLFDVLSVCDAAFSRREALPRDRDRAMAAGERMIVRILTALVRKEGLGAAAVDAASLIVTDERHQNANPMPDLIEDRVDQVLRPMIEANFVPLITGFIGATRTGAVTTLGRGGSDYTATLLASSLHADEVWIWTAVDGVMSADPALVPGARVIPVLSYDEVGELSYFGAHVIHTRAAEPLIAGGIPLRVRSPFNLDHAGTLIQAESADTASGLKAVTAIDGLYLTTTGHSVDLGEALARIHEIVGRTVAGPVMVTQSRDRLLFVLVVPTSEGPTAASSAALRLSVALGTEKWEVRVVKVIATMGMGGRQALSQLATTRIQPLLEAIGPEDRYLLAVSPADVQNVVRHLHEFTNQPSPTARISQRGTWPVR